jgi:hypothetical protein
MKCDLKDIRGVDLVLIQGGEPENTSIRTVSRPAEIRDFI